MMSRVGNTSIRRLLLLSLPFVLAGFFAARNLGTWPARITYPGDESYEGVPLAEMIHLRQGLPIYGAGARDMFDAATYGPLFYLLGERLVNPADPSYFPLRVLSALAVLGCAACCGLLAFWLSGSQWAAWLSAVVFLSYGMTTGHGILALSDGVSLFLSFSAFLVAYRFRDSRAILFAAPVMVLGFYYKPQYVAGSVAVFLFLLLEKKLRVAIEFVGLLAACGLGMFTLFEWVVFRGQAFWRHFLLYQSALLSWRFLGVASFVFALLFLLPLIFAIDYLREVPNKIITLYFIVSVATDLVAYCKAGSGLHYYFECVLLLSVLIPVLLAMRLKKGLYPLDVVLVLALMTVAGQWATHKPPTAADIVQNDALQSFLQQSFPPNSTALALDPGELLQAGLRAPFSGLFQLAQLSQRNIVSDRDLVMKIRGHCFGAILLFFDPTRERDAYWLRFYTPEILNAIERNYRLETSLDMPFPLRNRARDRFYVYVPRSVRGSM